MKEPSKEVIYFWTFDDRKNRWLMWYIIALSIAIWFIIWWFITGQYGMSFLLILIIWVTYFVENSSEDIITVSITELWINVSNIFYDFSRITSYCFIYDNENAIYMKLTLNKRWVWFIKLRVDNEIVANLKQILPNFIQEDPQKDLTFSEKIINLLKL